MKPKTIVFTGWTALFVCLTTLVLGQVPRLSDQPTQFITDLQTALNGTRNPAVTRLGTDLSAAWTSGKITPAQQTQVIAATKVLTGKGYRLQPHLVEFWEAINQAVAQSVPAADLESFLTTTQKFIPGIDQKTGQRYLELARDFYSKRLLYTSPVHRYYALGGSGTFRFSTEAFTLGSTQDTTKAKTTNSAAALEDDGWGFDNPKAKSADGWDELPVPIGGTIAIFAPPPTLAPGPLLELKGVTLVLSTANDSLSIQNASGTIGIKEGLLLGSAGQVSWGLDTIRAGASVALTQYRVDLKNPKITADEATLTEPKLLAAPVKGSYEFFSKKRPPRQEWSYPRFLSANSDVKLKSLGTDLDYKGGIALIGPRLYGVATGLQPATFNVKRGGKVAFSTSSRRFEWSDSLLSSPQASLTAYLSSGDSVTHPAIRLQYSRANGELHTNRLAKGGYRTAPFSDSYHALFINADALNWKLGSQRMDFYTISARTEVPVRLESFDYFDVKRYRELSGNYGFHPLTALAAYFRERGGKQEAVVSDLTPFFRRPAANVREALMEMVQQGYLTYNPATDVISFSKKGRHYVQANVGKEDYDTFLILSKFNNNMRDSLANASLNLADNQLTVRGAQRFQVSDSLKIFMAPSDEQVKIGKNRDFTFNGEMKLDNYRFRGQNLSFNYDKFFVKLDKVDSVTFVSQKNKGRNDAPEIGADLQYAGGGTVYLGKAGNRSGKTPNAPRLVVPGGAKIYFDQPTRESGVYSRKIYFQIPNLDYDSLTSRDIRFEGTFYSDGILPPFKATLVTMPDNSLGFVYKTPSSLPVYGGPSSIKLNGAVQMDKSGLYAAGELHQNGAVLPSEKIRLFPDSVVVSGKQGSITASVPGAKVQLPAVAFKNYVAKWLPRKDSLLLTSQTDPFDFYAGTTRLTGDLLLQASGLFGTGVVKRKDSETKSKKFQFTKDNFTAESAELRIGTNLAAGGKAVLLGKEMDVNFNVASGNAVIQKPKRVGFQGDSSALEFPVAAYKTTITRADWNTTAKTIAMKGDVKTSEFIATAPEQQGLRFNAAEALYEMEKMTLTLKGVPYVQSADARIYPARNQVVIKQDAAMQPFTKAKIVLDTVNAYHTLADGTVRILSRNAFEGNATYQLVKAKGDTTRLKMGAFEIKEKAPAAAVASTSRTRRPNTLVTAVQKDVYTTATANVLEADKFFLNPRMQYRGEITMRSPEQGLRFNGAIRLDLKSRPDQAAWIDFNNSASDDANIRVDEKLRGDGQPLYVGLHLRSASSGLYTTFVSPKEAAADPDILLATGQLTDVPKTSQLQVQPDALANDQTLEGNRFILDDARKTVQLQGRFNLFQPASIGQAAGTARIQPDSNKYQFNTLLAFNFPLPAPVLAAMGDKLVQTNLDEKNTDPAEPDADRLQVKLANTVGGKAADAYRDKAAGGYLPLPTTVPALNKALVLTNVSLRWSDENSAFYSVGRIGVSNVGGIDINAALDGRIEIRKNPGAADDVFIYLEASPEVWYYWGYKQEQTGLVSSDEAFNNVVTAQAKAKAPFMPVSEDEKVLFLERFEQLYLPRQKAKPAATKPAPAKPATVPSQPVTTTPGIEKPGAVPSKTDAAVPAKATPAKAPASTPAKPANAATKAKPGTAVPAPAKPQVPDAEEPAPKKPAEKQTGF